MYYETCFCLCQGYVDVEGRDYTTQESYCLIFAIYFSYNPPPPPTLTLLM
jgi:hypothetical protein